MMSLTRRALIAAPALVALPAFADDLTPTDTLVLKTKYGETIIKLRPDLAPNHVKQIQALVSQKFYDGIVFHRVIPGFMAQTGDPTGTGSGGSKLPDVAAEFNPAHFQRGTLGMARSNDPDSANSQFFICLDDAGFLDHKYTVFGEVTSGMEFIDKLKAGTQANNGKVDHPDKIISIRFAPDAK